MKKIILSIAITFLSMLSMSDSIIPVYAWPRVIEAPGKQIINPSIDICLSYGYRLLPAHPDTPTGKTIQSETIIQDPENPIMAKYVIVYADDPNYAMLVTVSSMYKTFLTNEWTGELRSAGIIDPSTTIDWLNTPTATNITYLIMLRTLDTVVNKPTYSYYKNEFESFRINIERLGGSLGNLP